MDLYVRSIRSDTTLRHSLAEKRQRLWRDLSSGLLTQREYDEKADEVVRLTALLNGHAYDTLDPFRRSARKPARESGGGLYHDKRIDRMEVEKALGIHETDRDKHGRAYPFRSRRSVVGA